MTWKLEQVSYDKLTSSVESLEAREAEKHERKLDSEKQDKNNILVVICTDLCRDRPHGMIGSSWTVLFPYASLRKVLPRMASSIYVKTLEKLVDDLAALCQKKRLLGEDADDSREWRRNEDALKGCLLALSALVSARALDKALDIVSSGSSAVIQVSCPSGRSVFHVRGQNGEYKVLPIGFCTCLSFGTERNGTFLPICKHILAARLAQAQGTCEVRNVTDEDWATHSWNIRLPRSE